MGEEDARRDFTHRERLTKAFPQPSKRPSRRNDDHPLQQNQLQIALQSQPDS